MHTRFAGLLLVAAVGGVTAAPVAAVDTLGATLGPLPVVFNVPEPVVRLTNRSTIPVIVTLTADAGWTLATYRLDLEPLEEAVVPVTAAGTDGATIRASLTGRDVTAGTDAVSLVLETRAQHDPPPPPSVPWWPFLLLLALVPVWAVLRRHRES